MCYHMKVIVCGRPWLGWMDGVNVDMSSRGMTEEAARQCAKDKSAEPCCRCRCIWFSFTRIFLIDSGILTNRPSALWWLITWSGMGSSYMHDEVGVNSNVLIFFCDMLYLCVMFYQQ